MEIQLPNYIMTELIKHMILQILELISILQQIQGSVAIQKVISNSRNVLLMTMDFQIPMLEVL